MLKIKAFWNIARQFMNGSTCFQTKTWTVCLLLINWTIEESKLKKKNICRHRRFDLIHCRFHEVSFTFLFYIRLQIVLVSQNEAKNNNNNNKKNQKFKSEKIKIEIQFNNDHITVFHLSGKHLVAHIDLNYFFFFYFKLIEIVLTSFFVWSLQLLTVAIPLK